MRKTTISSLIALFVASAASAQISIGVNFTQDIGTGSLDANVTTGVVSAANWNNTFVPDAVDSVAQTNTYLNLNNDSGSATATDLDLLGSTANGNWNTGGAWDPLFTGRTDNNGFTATFTDIEFDLYDVYVYIGAGSLSNKEWDITGTDADGAVNLTYTASALAVNAATSFVEAANGTNTTAGNYFKVSGLTGATLVVGADGTGGGRQAFTTGIQIVAVPEPSSYALIAGFFGLAWVMVRRRRA